MITEVTDRNLESFLYDADKTVIVDFWAPWCGPCKTMAPEFEAFDMEHSQHFKIGKVNVDEYPEIAGVFNVFSIPTILVFDGGEMVKTIIGARNAERLAGELTEYMK
jgi:thioredoxin 1